MKLCRWVSDADGFGLPLTSFPQSLRSAFVPFNIDITIQPNNSAFSRNTFDKSGYQAHAFPTLSAQQIHISEWLSSASTRSLRTWAGKSNQRLEPRQNALHEAAIGQTCTDDHDSDPPSSCSAGPIGDDLVCELPHSLPNGQTPDNNPAPSITPCRTLRYHKTRTYTDMACA